MAQKRRKKTGSIALPYLVTIFIGILLIGGGTFLFLNHMGLLGGEKELPEPTPRQITTTTYADNHTILFILDEPRRLTQTAEQARLLNLQTMCSASRPTAI